MSTLTNTRELSSNCCDLGIIADKIKDGACWLAFGVAATVFIVAHPIIGPLGSLGCLIMAAYDGILLNYHWRHSREKNEKGELIEGTDFIAKHNRNEIANFRDKDAVFKPSDLERLKHEVDRLYYVKSAADDLRWARGLAKCSVPILGPVWALYTEGKANGSVAGENYEGSGHISDQEWFTYQIQKLEGKNPQVPVAGWGF